MDTDYQSNISIDGFIRVFPADEIQPEFQQVVDDVCTTLADQIGYLLDGIYLYGSVANASAIPGYSDLDLSLVLRSSASQEEHDKIASIRLVLQARHGEVSKIDFDIGTRAEVLATENLHSWGYWLRHHCRCLWGNDLSKNFAPFRPSRMIAMAVNGDFRQRLAAYATDIGAAKNLLETMRLQKEASRKLIRSTNILRSEHDQDWPHTLEEHVDRFVLQYPSMGVRIAFFLSQARSPDALPPLFLCQFQYFADWMAAASEP